MKKTAGIIFSVLLLVCFSTGGALNAQQFDDESDFVTAPIDEGRSLMITAHTAARQVVNIPPSIQGMPVTAIGEGAFRNRRLTSVSIPAGIRTIEAHAFSGNRLAAITIPPTVNRIEDQAFQGNHLTEVTIPDSVIVIGDGAFMNNRLSRVTIPNTMIMIGSRAFMSNSLDHVTILNSMATVGSQAFLRNGIRSITIGANVQVDSTAFGNNFFDFYNSNRQRAGVYTWRGREWAFSAE